MDLALIIPVLIAGFWHCHIDPRERIRLFHYGGQYLYFRSAALGLRSFAVALVICLGFHFLLPDHVTLWQHTIPFQPISWLKEFISPLGLTDATLQTRVAWFCALSLGTFLVVLCWSGGTRFIHTLRYPDKDLRLHVLEKLFQDSPLDSLLLQHLDRDDPVMLTMRDRKVYVGSLIAFAEPALSVGGSRTIAILPQMSGYRDEQTQTVTFTTFYDTIGVTVPPLVLRQEDILSATSFSVEAYDAWNSPSSEEPDTPDISSELAGAIGNNGLSPAGPGIR